MKKFIIITVASENNKELNRFLNSLINNNLDYIVLGLDEKWKGGDMSNGSGGGQKVNLLKRELRQWNDSQLNSTIILFSDSYDVINLSSGNEIIKKYEKMGIDKIVFSSEKTCWPDIKLSNYYPYTNSAYKYLNSGGFIGMANNILKLLNITSISDDYDDQLFYTKLFLSRKTKIVLDYNCDIFQTLNNAEDDIEIYYTPLNIYTDEYLKWNNLSKDIFTNSNVHRFNHFVPEITKYGYLATQEFPFRHERVNKNRIVNKLYNTTPCLIHGNGPIKIKKFLFELNEILIENNVYVFLHQ